MTELAPSAGLLRGERRELMVGAALAVSLPLQLAIGLPCPSRAAVHLDCPLCGGTRAALDLADGRLAEAVSHNVGVLVIGGAVVLWLVLTAAARLGHEVRPASLRRRAPTVLIGSLLAWAVIRNLPWWPGLQSATG